MKTGILGLMLIFSGSCNTIDARNWQDLPPGSTFDGSGEYLIGPLDDLNVLVIGQEQLSGPMPVSNRGKLAMPLAGEISVVGLTTGKAAKAIEEGLRSFVKSPAVNVSVAARRSFRVHFAGQVARVGQIQFDGPINILEGLAQSGGLTPFATGRIVVIRITQNGPERYAVDYKELLKGKKAVNLARLERGDYVYAE